MPGMMPRSAAEGQCGWPRRRQWDRVRTLMFVAIVGVGLGHVGTGAVAGLLETPNGPVILTVSGAIQNTNADDGAKCDRAMLERIGTSVVTHDHPVDRWRGHLRAGCSPVIS